MRLRYLAVIKLARLPMALMPLTAENIGKVLDVKGWTVTHQELRDYGNEYWVTLERDVQPPLALLPCCEVHGDRSVQVVLPSA